MVDTGTGDRIVANSIFGNGAAGILLENGGNHNLAAPSNVSAQDGTVSGTVTGTPGESFFLEIFRNASCDAAGNGEGETYLVGPTVQIPTGETSFDWSEQMRCNGRRRHHRDGDGHVDRRHLRLLCVRHGRGQLCRGALDGSVDSTPNDAVDLTAAGSSDWALWNHGLDAATSSLTPTDTKATGGRQISDMTVTGDASSTTRNFGQYGRPGHDDFNSVPFHFDWGDGTPTVSGTQESAGITAPQAGTGISFKAPADTTQRTLTVWTSAHYANGTLTASLSDGSAPDKSWQVAAVQGQSTGTGENVPYAFTITYAAAHADQHLTVTLQQDTNNCGSGCDDVVVYGAALNGPASNGNATGVTSTLSSGRSVGMSGSEDSIAACLSRRSSRRRRPRRRCRSTACRSTASRSTASRSTGCRSTACRSTGCKSTVSRSMRCRSTACRSTDCRSTACRSTGCRSTGSRSTASRSTGSRSTACQINGLPLDHGAVPGGWPVLLAGTSLADKPLQSITLQDVLQRGRKPLPPSLPGAARTSRSPTWTFSGSPLGQVTVAALTLARLPINGLPAELDSTIETQLDRGANRSPPTRPPPAARTARSGAPPSSSSRSPAHRSRAFRSTGSRSTACRSTACRSTGSRSTASRPPPRRSGSCRSTASRSTGCRSTACRRSTVS